MSDISSYPTATPTGSDLILGSQKDDSNIFHTKNFTAQSIADLGSGGGSYLPLTGGTLTGNLNINNAELRINSNSPKIKVIDTASGTDLFFEETIGKSTDVVARRQVWDNIAGQGIKTTFTAPAAGGTRHWQYQNDFAWSVNDTEEVLRIRGDVNGTGKVGIKTTNPQAELDVNGVIMSSGRLELTTNGRGIVLKSPDGTAYRITVDNAGSLVVTAV